MPDPVTREGQLGMGPSKQIHETPSVDDRTAP